MSATLLVAIGAGVAVLTGIGAGALAEATAIYGFVIALLIILFLG